MTVRVYSLLHSPYRGHRINHAASPVCELFDFALEFTIIPGGLCIYFFTVSITEHLLCLCSSFSCVLLTLVLLCLCHTATVFVQFYDSSFCTTVFLDQLAGYIIFSIQKQR